MQLVNSIGATLQTKYQKILVSFMLSQNQIQVMDLEDSVIKELFTILKVIVRWDKLYKASFEILNQPSILNLLSNIKFKDLRILGLKHNLIESLDSLINIQAPELQKLDVSFNLLTSIKPIKKLKAPKLKQLILQQNFIIQFCFLTKLQNKCLKIVNIQKFNSQIFQTNICFILPKLETYSKKFNATVSNSDLVFKNNRLEEVLFNRFVDSKDFWPIFDC